MYMHIVLMAFESEADARFFETVEHYARRIRAECDGVLGYGLYANEASRAQGFGYAMVSTFESAAAHDAYQISPAHQEMKTWMTPLIQKMVVFDSPIAAQ
ncbi:Dabb family protein [Kerstersia sp.]|uniref:Dabb family protein n=1 Tax=Kerstersia sp. TaxID=1930783 RepID=UPI003F8DE371